MIPRRIHSSGTVVLSLAMVVIGVALIVEGVSGHGSVISARLLLGFLFVAAGSGRLYVEARRSRGG